MKYLLTKQFTNFFLSASIFVSVLLVEAVVLTLIGQFKTLFVYLSLIPAFVLATFFSIQIKKDIRLLPKITAPTLLLILLISLILVFYPHDTFGGRDESVYTNYAVHLAQTGSLKIPAYLDNLHDKLAEGVRIMPPAYYVWVGVQKVFLGTPGLLRSNVTLIIFGLLAFFAVCSLLGNKKLGLTALTVYSFSMPFLWFSRETMSENLSFFLLWTLILFFLLCLKTKKLVYLTGVFLCSWLFALTRLEGFLIQLVILIVLPAALFLNKSFSYKKIITVSCIYLLVVASNIFIVNHTYGQTLKTVVPAVGQSVKKDIADFLFKKTPTSFSKPPSIAERVSRDTIFKNFFVFVSAMLAKYNFFIIIVSIFLVIFQVLSKIKKITPQRSYFLLTFFIILPEFYKLINPGVTLDQPWFYRRYLYALLPLGYFSFFLLIDQLKNRRLFTAVFGCLFLINIFLAKDILFLKNNWSLIDKLEEITKDISQNDLVIIRERPLGYYSPSSFLVLKKGIRSTPSSILRLQDFFPEKKIFNGVAYNKIFLLSKNDKDNLPSFDNVSRQSVDVEYSQLTPSCQLNFLGVEEGLVNAYAFGKLSIPSVLKYCSLPENEIKNYQEKLYLYELSYENTKTDND